ncbi:histone-fold-containing protein [Fimicolochytrium jonesii]|uniref:histone-fold-containing protein n=1 Tax=Fimicolochytrium jonesii TaxID=1396493 RepID=UPI0022FE924F|nr:histone-fold-containing protein [Fimicolochytrium jonesii]KAI8816083.1 histone-fold-containing protein [Fimicolochytrium jonesii]
MQKRYKTKFPVARIKKIMRTDDEVGKVAQVTPVLISKALELFMAALIDQTCRETRTRNAKKMTTAHLKRTILEVDTFDFLAPLVEALPDPGGGGGPTEAGDASPTTTAVSSSITTAAGGDEEGEAAKGKAKGARRGRSAAGASKEGRVKDEEEEEFV